MWHPRHKAIDDSHGELLARCGDAWFQANGEIGCDCDDFDRNAWCEHISNWVLYAERGLAPLPTCGLLAEHAVPRMLVPVNDPGSGDWAWIDVQLRARGDDDFFEVYLNSPTFFDFRRAHDLWLAGPLDDVRHVGRLLRHSLDRLDVDCPSSLHRTFAGSHVRDAVPPLTRLDKLWIVTERACVPCYQKMNLLLETIDAELLEDPGSIAERWTWRWRLSS